MLPKNERTCFACKHIEFSYEGDYSDITPGEGTVLRCFAGHFSFRNADFDRDDSCWHETITLARNCDRYAEVKNLR